MRRWLRIVMGIIINKDHNKEFAEIEDGALSKIRKVVVYKQVK